MNTLFLLIAFLLSLVVWILSRLLRMKAQLQQFSREQARLEASINSLNAGFILTDKQSEIIMMNAAAKRALCKLSDIKQNGITIDPEFISMPCSMDDIQTSLKGVLDLKLKIREAISSQKPVDIKDTVINNRFFHIFLAPIVVVKDKDFDIEIIGCAILVEDVTEEKIIQRSKDEFFSIASHELRTPLTSIRGNSSLIKDYYADKLVDKDLKEMIEDINAASIRLIEIVNDFLNLSRLEQGKIEYNPEQFDLTELVTGIITELVPLSREKNLQLIFKKPTVSLPHSYADKEKVKQIIENLISNAIKYTDKGKIELEILAEKDFLKVVVSDTGRGISPQNQNLLFRKFQQAGDSLYTRDTTKGTGLGLYISKLLSEGIGGQIGLEGSTVGKGSKFFFTIPVAK